jgi:hypothetical protein
MVAARGKTRKRRVRLALTLLAAMVGAVPAFAEPRAVVELFTSQGCSSCPPADRLIGELATSDPSIITLSFPIDYWDYLGWKDTLAQPKFSARQRGYAHKRGDREVYTPQAVVNGVAHALGSNRTQIVDTIATTRKRQNVMSVPVSLSVNNSQVAITVPASATVATPQAEIWICAVAREIYVNVGRGENRGREIAYHNVVRRWLKVADWTGRAGTWAVPIENLSGDDIDSTVVYVQEGTRDKPGIMLGAATASLK